MAGIVRSAISLGVNVVGALALGLGAATGVEFDAALEHATSTAQTNGAKIRRTT
jgi:hypothetical protein